MAAATYTTDLVDLDLANTTTNWTNIGTGALAAETDFYVQGGTCVSKPGWTGDATRGAIFNSGSGKTINSPNAYFAWVYFWGPAALETEANGGLQLIIGSSTTAYKQWYIRGSDSILPFDGWSCTPIDTTVAASATTGSPTATLQYFGALARIKAGSAIGKGNPLGVDAIRYGRGELRIANGDLANGYATFSSAETTANSSTNRWGLFQAISGGYLWQGLLILGYAAAVDFRDSNRSIVVSNTKKVVSTFNKIEIRNVSSRVDWTNISIAPLGTVSRGDLEVVDDCDVNLDSCTFTDMGTFIFKSLSSITNCTFRRTDQITIGGATVTKCLFDSNRASTALLATQPAQVSAVSDTSFISDGTGHAIQINGTAANITLNKLIFTGYASSNGTTGNEAIFVNITSGSMTLTVSGGNTPSIRTAGASVTVVSGATVTFTGLPTGTDIVILTAGTSTILQQVDQNGGTSYAWGYQGTPTVDVGFINPGYRVRYLRNLPLGSSDSSIPVELFLDKDYLP